MRTVKSDSNGLPQIWAISATTLTRGGTGNLTATFTSTLPHRLSTGDYIRVKGADLAYFNSISLGGENSEFQVTVTSPTVFTYTMSADPGGNANVTAVVAQKCISTNNYEPFCLVSPDNYLLVAGAAIEIDDNVIGPTVGDGTVKQVTTDQSIFYRQATIYGIISVDGNGVPTYNANPMPVGTTATALTDVVLAGGNGGGVVYTVPNGQKKKLANIRVKPANTDGYLVVYS